MRMEYNGKMDTINVPLETVNLYVGGCSLENHFKNMRDDQRNYALEINADGIIPSGAAFGNALKNGITTVHRDTFHAKLGAGRFILALVWYQYLTSNNTYIDMGGE